MDNFVEDFRDCNAMRSNGAPCYSEVRLGEAKQRRWRTKAENIMKKSRL